jgi:hypothetical protein
MKSFFPMIFPPTILILSLSVPTKWKEIVPNSGAPPPPSLYAYMTAMIHGVSIPNTNA